MPRFIPRSQRWTVTIDQQPIDVTSDSPTWRETWSTTDSNGHEHVYNRARTGGIFPTLNHVIDVQHWCDGTEGWMPHDPHIVVDEDHWECKICGETVTPAMDPGGTPKSIPGRVDARLSGYRSDGTKVEAWLLPDDLEWLRDPHRTDDEVTAFLDSLPADRLTAVEFASR